MKVERKDEKVVLITGGAGFIGSHLTEEYLKHGYTVVIVDDLSSGSLTNIDHLLCNRCFFEKVNIENFKDLKCIFQKYKPNVVNHHAAQKSVSYSVENPVFDANVNIIGLLNVLECCGEFKVKTFLYTSSGGALATEIVGDLYSKEIDYPQLLSPYAISKFAGEYYTRVYSEKYGFKFSIQRYANVYGPRQVADGECGVIPIFVNNLLEQKESKLMTYKDMPRGCTRDYIYVKDVAEFNILATQFPKNDVFNLGNTIELPILTIYEEIESIFNIYQHIEICGPRPGDIKRSVLDCTKVKKYYDWKPKYNLHDGLLELYNFMFK